MSDDGTGRGIRIPAMLIGKNDGDILKKFLMTSNKEDQKEASLTAQFVIKATDKVEWELWYTSASDTALDFLKSFKKDQEKLLGSPENF